MKLGPSVAVHVSTSGLKRRSIKPASVRRYAERMLGCLRLDDAELSVVLCDDETIRELNRQWRDEDRPTDVLAFAMEDGELGLGPNALLGDIVISMDTARRQAHARGRAVSHEVTMLLAHGLLHLLGYDHRDPPEERRMNALTDVLRAAAQGGAGTPAARG